MSAETETPNTAAPVTPAADAAPPPQAAAPVVEPPAKPAPIKAAAPAHEQPTPPREPSAPRPDTQDAVVTALQSLQRDNAALDVSHKEAIKRAEKAERERDRLAAEVEGFARGKREDAIVRGVRERLPHTSELTIRGTLTALHEQKVVDRFSDKTDDAVKAALEAIKTHAPDLARVPPPNPGRGGPAGAPQGARRPGTYKSPF